MSARLAAGQVLDGRLTLTRPLGRGGMGEVWAAHSSALGTEVAVKFMLDALDSPEARERFQREAKLPAQIKSPHIVTVFDARTTEDGAPYVVMELLEGESLGARLRRAGMLSPSEVDEVVTQAARGLAAAHDIGVVHRDLKPDNVFLVRVPGDGGTFVKLLDFGIARQETHESTPALTKTGTAIGTLRYMSPEQLDDSRHVGPSADVWALAVIAYEALTGRLPFNGESAVALWRAMQESRPPAPSELRAGLDAQVDRVFARALSRAAEERIEGARRLAEELHGALAIATDPTLAQPSPGRLGRAEADVRAGGRDGASGAPVSSAPLPSTTGPRKRNPMRLFLTLVIVLFFLSLILVLLAIVYGPWRHLH